MSKVKRLVKVLKDFGAMKYTTVVVASSSDPAPLWYLAPYSGTSLGEYFRDKGLDALVIYDDLTKHAWAWRQISLLLKRPAGREAYPGDIFYLHSRLLERAAKLKNGGSLTAIPIIETQLGDITSYIPTNVISITDGQIYLESDLFFQGQRPAINIGLSVSRVGSSAQTKAIKKVAGMLRLEMAKFRELQAFLQFASELDESTQKRLKHGQVLLELLKQKNQSTITFDKLAVLLWAGINGYFDEFPLNEIKNIEENFLQELEEQEFLKDIREKKEITQETENKIKDFVIRFFEKLKKYEGVKTN
jgi:F-type H+-transporting ATPase subunit alpha